MLVALLTLQLCHPEERWWNHWPRGFAHTCLGLLDTTAGSPWKAIVRNAVTLPVPRVLPRCPQAGCLLLAEAPSFFSLLPPLRTHTLDLSPKATPFVEPEVG